MAGAPRARAKYADVRSDLKSGDLVLFSGSSFFSSVIKWAVGGRWSHVGVVVRVPAFPDRVALWEATTLADLADIETGRAAAGVQLVFLSDRLTSYAGEFKLRALDRPITPEMDARFAARRAELSGRPYEVDELELFHAAFDGWFAQRKRERLHSLFCSELVAEAYQALGLLPEPPLGPPSNEYTPRDFARRLRRLLRGYTLGRIVAIG
ncbi:MAG TPA: hypothetical protein VII78_10050 [Myxococcota bacterium]